ncbi:hypothetical protein [Fulvivirga imtechensis]|uniref:hypothetical protein n=1 Tax=Fulvivirga imtechensis TaxID=881893 RepID=UPI0012F9CC1A|nr:hypothetical protein [Fulvivirga imtechensis]
MRQKIRLIALFILLFCACENKNKDDEAFLKSLPDIQGITKDTVLFDKNGNPIKVYVNPSHKTENIEKVNSVGGELFYLYYSDENNEPVYDSIENKKKLKKVFHYDYINEFFDISMKTDTVKLGKEFIGNIYSQQKDIRIEIKGLDEVLTSEDLPYTHKIKATELGIYSFSGIIYTFGENYPFEYKYIVVAADSISND